MEELNRYRKDLAEIIEVRCSQSDFCGQCKDFPQGPKDLTEPLGDTLLRLEKSVVRNPTSVVNNAKTFSGDSSSVASRNGKKEATLMCSLAISETCRELTRRMLTVGYAT